MTESTYVPKDRRPIHSRQSRWAQGVTTGLVRIGVSPNAISVFGMLSAIAGGIAFGMTESVQGVGHRGLWFVGGVLCQLRLLCNLFDGMVAVERQIASRRGELYNEVPDRVSDVAVFIGLGFATTGDAYLGCVAALVCVFVAYVRAMAKSIGAPNDFCGPMAKPQRMALATALAVYMSLSPSAWRLPWGEATIVLWVVVLGGIATALRRLIRASRFLQAPPEEPGHV